MIRTSLRSHGRIDPADVMETLARAFAHDPVVRWLYPDDDVYVRALPEFVMLAAGSAFDDGTVEVAGKGSAAAIWVAPDVDVDRAEAGARWAAHFQQHVDEVRLGDVFAWGEQVGAAHPTEPHWYLAALAVAPQMQGQGLGTALLRAGLDRCDRDGLPAYLESGNPRSRGLYERNGFEVTTELHVADAPPSWPMLRPAVHGSGPA